MILEDHTVPEGQTPQRLSDYAVGIFVTLPSRKGVKKAIKRGELLLNGRPGSTGDWVLSGAVLELLAPEPRTDRVLEISFPVIYEDSYLGVVRKPGGLVTSGNLFRSLEQALPFNLRPSAAPDALPWPRPLHRLDGPTAGLVLIAKTRSAQIDLGRQFEAHQIKKRYRAIVVGIPPETGTFSTPVDGKPAHTEFRTIRTLPSLRNGYLSAVDLFPTTGRTHQLRRHLAEAGFPILGDKEYGTEEQIMRGKGLFLAAVELGFQHPESRERQIVTVPEPNKFNRIMEREFLRWQNFQSDGRT